MMLITSLASAASVCDTGGFERIAGGWIHMTQETIEFRVREDEVRDHRDLSAPTTIDAVLAREQAQAAIRHAYSAIVPPPVPTASLVFHGLRSEVAMCDSQAMFDYLIPIAGLVWQVEDGHGEADLLPPIRQFLRDNGFAP
jgi:hypothetical protein